MVRDSTIKFPGLEIYPIVQSFSFLPPLCRSITEPVMEGEEEDHSVDSAMPAGDEGIIIGTVGGPEPMGYAIDQDASMASGANEGGEDINSVDLLATAVNLVSQAQMTKGEYDGGRIIRGFCIVQAV